MRWWNEKKYAYPIVSFNAVNCLSGKWSNNGFSSNHEIIPEIIEPHNPEQAEQSGDVVVLHGGIRNEDKWDTFMKNVKKKQQDQVRVTMYTIEGGPIIQELIYDGTAIQSTYDNSKGIGTMKSEQGHIFYVLTGCEKEENPFWMPKF